MTRFHPTILLADLFKAADCIGCCLKTDRRGHLVISPLAEAQPINPERHGNGAVLPIRQYRRINTSYTPKPEVVV